MDRKRKILIIDDEIDFAEIVKWNLEKTKRFRVNIETRGKQGVATAKKIKPDLILLDIMMPDMRGEKVECQLKSNKTIKDIPVIFLTAVIKENTMSSEDSLKHKPFILTKPVSLKKLIDSIEKTIKEYRDGS